MFSVVDWASVPSGRKALGLSEAGCRAGLHAYITHRLLDVLRQQALMLRSQGNCQNATEAIANQQAAHNRHCTENSPCSSAVAACNPAQNGIRHRPHLQLWGCYLVCLQSGAPLINTFARAGGDVQQERAEVSTAQGPAVPDLQLQRPLWFFMAEKSHHVCSSDHASLDVQAATSCSPLLWLQYLLCLPGRTVGAPFQQ